MLLSSRLAPSQTLTLALIFHGGASPSLQLPPLASLSDIVGAMLKLSLPPASSNLIEAFGGDSRWSPHTMIRRGFSLPHIFRLNSFLPFKINFGSCFFWYLIPCNLSNAQTTS